MGCSYVLLEETEWPTCTNKFSILLSVSFYFKVRMHLYSKLHYISKQSLRGEDMVSSSYSSMSTAELLNQASHRKGSCLGSLQVSFTGLASQCPYSQLSQQQLPVLSPGRGEKQLLYNLICYQFRWHMQLTTSTSLQKNTLIWSIKPQMGLMKSNSK